MAIYKQNGNKLILVKEKKIDLEKTVQNLIEENLSKILGLKFVCSEFPLNNLRIDTLAFDEELKSFVIIEYKKDKSFSVIDQGFAYLAMLLNNKADFVLAYNEKCKKNLRKEDIDWSQSRVIFVANSFTKYQQEAIGFKDLPIELWEVSKYEDNLILFNELRTSEKSESIKKIVAKDKNVEIVSREIRQYSLNDHFKPNWGKAKTLFDILSQRILDLDSKFEIHPVKNYIGYNINGKNVVNVKTRVSSLLLELLRVKPEDLKDPENKVVYIESSFANLNKHVSKFDIKTEDDIDYALMLIKQVYKKFAE
jgi:predicted transport protein